MAARDGKECLLTIAPTWLNSADDLHRRLAAQRWSDLGDGPVSIAAYYVHRPFLEAGSYLLWPILRDGRLDFLTSRRF